MPQENSEVASTQHESVSVQHESPPGVNLVRFRDELESALTRHRDQRTPVSVEIKGEGLTVHSSLQLPYDVGAAYQQLREQSYTDIQAIEGRSKNALRALDERSMAGEQRVEGEYWAARKPLAEQHDAAQETLFVEERDLRGLIGRDALHNPIEEGVTVADWIDNGYADAHKLINDEYKAALKPLHDEKEAGIQRINDEKEAGIQRINDEKEAGIQRINDKKEAGIQRINDDIIVENQAFIQRVEEAARSALQRIENASSETLLARLTGFMKRKSK